MSTVDTKDRLKDRAADLANDARDTVADAAQEQAAEARDAAVDQADTMSDAAHDARQNFDSGSLQAEALRAVSQQIEGLTERLRDRPIEELIDDAAVFARRNPLLVLGGAAVLGFAAARFFKAEPSSVGTRGDDPWSTGFDPDHRSTS